MALGYRAILKTEPRQSNLDGILAELKSWLARKGFPDLPTSGTHDGGHGRKLRASQIQSGETMAFRWTLGETWGLPEWASSLDAETTGYGETRITLSFTGEQIWLWTDIEPPTITIRERDGKKRTQDQHTGTPKFIQAILGEVEMQDGVASPLPEFQSIRSVKRLIANESVGAV